MVDVTFVTFNDVVVRLVIDNEDTVILDTVIFVKMPSKALA